MWGVRGGGAQVDGHMRVALGERGGNCSGRLRRVRHARAAQRRAQHMVHNAQPWVAGLVRAEVDGAQRRVRQLERRGDELRALMRA